MDTFETIKKFLNDGGKCLLIEDGEAIGVVLTINEYEALNNESRIVDVDKEMQTETIPANPTNPIGEALAQEIDYPELSADIADIQAVDDVTLEDLGIDEITGID